MNISFLLLQNLLPNVDIKDVDLKNPEITLVKNINMFYINDSYQKCIDNYHISSAIDEHDTQTKIAEIAMKNLIEYIKVFGYNSNENYFSVDGLYKKLLKNLCDENEYDVTKYSLVNYLEDGIQYGKHIKIKKIKTLLK